MADLLEPEEITFLNKHGKEYKFVISKIPAWDGCEIFDQIPMAALLKVGDYPLIQSLRLKMLGYVDACSGDRLIRLTNQTLIDNHVYDFEMVHKIEMAMIEKNCSFFQNGTLSAFLGDVAQKSLQKITEIFTQFSAQSSATGKPPSTSSGPYIP